MRLRSIFAFIGRGAMVALLLVILVGAGLLLYARHQYGETARDLAPSQIDARIELERQRERDIRRDVVTALVERAAAERGGPDEPARLDILVLSGGAQYGAFAAGFLAGWRTVQDPDWARPEADLVTGVSAGSMLSVSALLGSPTREDTVVKLFSRAREAWAFDELQAYLPWSASLLDGAPLRTAIRDTLGPETMRSLAEAHDAGRRLLVLATNADLGHPAVWELTSRSARGADPEDLTTRILASSSPPPILPPVEIDGFLHMDGGASHAFFLGPRSGLLIELVDALEAEGQLESTRLHIWVIISSPLYPAPTAVPRRWTALSLRGANALMFALARTDLERLRQTVLGLEHRAPGFAQLSWIAIPRELQNSDVLLFSAEFVRKLEAEGQRLGRDPGSWSGEAPRPR